MGVGPIKGVLAGDAGVTEFRRRVSWDDYLGIVAMNPSTLVHGLQSMKHLNHAWHRPDSPDTPSMQWGRALHCLLFERDEFALRYVECDLVRNTRHKAYQEFLAENEGREALTVEQYRSALQAAESFVGDEQVQAIIKAGLAEVTVLTVEMGIQCKHRIDWLAATRPDDGLLVDLKTTKRLDSRAVSRDFYKYHYDVKLGLYQRAMRKAHGGLWPVQVIWLENVPPYDTAVMPIDDAVLERGAAKGLAVLSRLRDCIEREEWPGVAADREFLLHVPQWEMDEDEDAHYSPEDVAA